MRAPAVSFVRKALAAILAVLLLFPVTPFAYADGESSNMDDVGAVAPGLPDQSNDHADSSLGEPQGVSADQNAEGSPVVPMLASGLVGKPGNFINSDVALDSEPVIGSFTVDGMTFAVIDDSCVEFVGIAPSVILSEAAEGGVVEGSDSDQVSEVGLANLVLPETVSYEGSEYALASIAPYAFYLSGVASVTLPKGVSDVDDRAFRSSDVASVTVAEGNPTYSSSDGALYDADQLSLLLIPEGKQGAVLLPKTAEVAEASVFSHCPLVDSISVEKDGAAFASENGLLYTSDLTTLLRVPAGATEITIREGCTAIAAGALEACAKLMTINAPATVTSISPDIFHAIPTVSLPAISALKDQSAGTAVLGLPGQSNASTNSSGADEGAVDSFSNLQLTATIALFSNEGGMPEMDSSAMQVVLSGEASAEIWRYAGFSVGQTGFSSASVGNEVDVPAASIQPSNSYRGIVYASYGPDDRSRGGYYVTSCYFLTPFTYDPNKKLYIARAPWTGDNRLGYRATLTGNADGTSRWTGNCTSSDGYKETQYENLRWEANPGYKFAGWSESPTGTPQPTFYRAWTSGTVKMYARFVPITYIINLVSNAADASVNPRSTEAVYGETYVLPEAVRPNYRCIGWNTEPDGSGKGYPVGTNSTSLSTFQDDIVTLYAQWAPLTLDFDVNSEPGDIDAPGDEKAPIIASDAVQPDGTISVDPPKRPGYIFQGWVPEGCPDDDSLLTKGEDGTWSVDSSKLPDYADEDGHVHLTARWIVDLDVDAPLSATFMYDLAQWDEAESRDAAVEGSSAFRNKSVVPIRVSGLESEKGEAASVLKKADGTTLADAPKGDSAKVLSVFPTTSDATGTEDDAKAPASNDSGDDMAHAVNVSLSEVELEASFCADGEGAADKDLRDAWSIPAAQGSAPGTLKVGYRLNLGQATGITLDRDALTEAVGNDEGVSVSLARLSWCFAPVLHEPTATGSTDDDLYIEYQGAVYGTDDIAAAAECIADHGKASPCYGLYDAIMRAQGSPAAGVLPADAGACIYARYEGAPATANCARQGYARVLLLGLAHDALEFWGSPDDAYDATLDSHQVRRRAGMTFQMMDLMEAAPMAASDSNIGGWEASSMRNDTLGVNGPVASKLAIYDRLKPVWKATNNMGGNVSTAASPIYWKDMVTVTSDKLFLLSWKELWGGLFNNTSYLSDTGYCYWLNEEGDQYPYWAEVCSMSQYQPPDYNIQANLNISCGSKLDATGSSVANWWVRRTAALDATVYGTARCSDGANVNQKASTSQGAAFAFCL